MIIAALLKLGEDEIAYINPASVFPCISGHRNRCVQAQLAFSSSHGPDPVPPHANRAVLSCLLMEVNEKKMAEFPRGEGFCISLLRCSNYTPPTQLMLISIEAYMCA